MCLAHPADFEEAKKRWPFLSTYGTRLTRIDGSGSIFEFDRDFQSAFLESCSLVNTRNGLVRAKNINLFSIFLSSIKSFELEKAHKDFLSPIISSSEAQVHGVLTSDLSEEDVIVASQLQKLYISRGVHETTIGDFFRTHPEIAKKTFCTDLFLYEQTLNIVDDNGNFGFQALNPDLIIRRPDGYFDILDLKLAKVDKASLFQGRNPRRRFHRLCF